jgi:hypothetical protein
MSTYSATIVYGWKGVCSMVPVPWCSISGFGLFADSITNGTGNVPIYGCECSIEHGSVIILNKELVDEGYAKIVEYCKKQHIVPPVLGIYPAIAGPIEWHP